MGPFVCWKCGESIESVPKPLGRLAECPGCRADLHVCRMCIFYYPRASQGCREPIAEQVNDKGRSNFCDYFQPRPGAYEATEDLAAQAAQEQLDALFVKRGDASPSSASGERATEDSSRAELERLFTKGD